VKATAEGPRAQNVPPSDLVPDIDARHWDSQAPRDDLNGECGSNHRKTATTQLPGPKRSNNLGAIAVSRALLTPSRRESTLSSTIVSLLGPAPEDVEEECTLSGKPARWIG
jgi:hypothetical protein